MSRRATRYTSSPSVGHVGILLDHPRIRGHRPEIIGHVATVISLEDSGLCRVRIDDGLKVDTVVPLAALLSEFSSLYDCESDDVKIRSSRSSVSTSKNPPDSKTFFNKQGQTLLPIHFSPEPKPSKNVSPQRNFPNKRGRKRSPRNKWPESAPSKNVSSQRSFPNRRARRASPRIGSPESNPFKSLPGSNPEVQNAVSDLPQSTGIRACRNRPSRRPGVSKSLGSSSNKISLPGSRDKSPPSPLSLRCVLESLPKGDESFSSSLFLEAFLPTDSPIPRLPPISISRESTEQSPQVVLAPDPTPPSPVSPGIVQSEPSASSLDPSRPSTTPDRLSAFSAVNPSMLATSKGLEALKETALQLTALHFSSRLKAPDNTSKRVMKRPRPVSNHTRCSRCSQLNSVERIQCFSCHTWLDAQYGMGTAKLSRLHKKGTSCRQPTIQPDYSTEEGDCIPAESAFSTCPPPDPSSVPAIFSSICLLVASIQENRRRLRVQQQEQLSWRQ